MFRAFVVAFFPALELIPNSAFGYTRVMRSFKELFEKVYSRLDLSVEESRDALFSMMELWIS